MSIPANLQYTSEHEWVRIDGDVAVVGITQYAADALGDVVYVDLPKTGQTIAAGAIVLSAIGQIVWVIGFSSFSVLFYYAIGHLSAFAQPKDQRKMPRWLNILGIALCLTLAFSFGWQTVVVSFGILGVALAIRWLWRKATAR